MHSCWAVAWCSRLHCAPLCAANYRCRRLFPSMMHVSIVAAMHSRKASLRSDMKPALDGSGLLLPLLTCSLCVSFFFLSEHFDHSIIAAQVALLDCTAPHCHPAMWPTCVPWLSSCQFSSLHCSVHIASVSDVTNGYLPDAEQ
ncbi:hypothetical protein TRVL_07705 [Trypanosoma vivax]|nr:hypothetical protein TRVL_07705 [Trypanosoma vivax]